MRVIKLNYHIYIYMEIGSDFNITINNNGKNKLFYVSGRLAIKTILNNILIKNDKFLIQNYL